MWGSRFDKPSDEFFARFNNSFRFDRRLYEADIHGSQAYARALALAGILTQGELADIQRGLEQVRAEFARGEWNAKADDEDVHSAVERRLFELIGETAHKLHTGRSRNDQVATDTRLYVMEACTRVDALLCQLESALVEQAQRHIDVIMPGYTHLRRAQPILFSHYMLSFFWACQRDRDRFAQTRDRAGVLPLGSGALAGNTFDIDRELLARELGFRTASQNSVDAVGDRDYIAEFLFNAALVQVHASHLAEDLIIYSSAEFDFVKIDDAYATGSSLMPQKKNPDSLELVRGKTGRVVGDLTALLVMLKGLPSSYNKDLQEDKESLFDAMDTLELTLPIVAGVVGTLQINKAKMRAALDEGMLATDLVDYLVRRGVPFREAHRLVGLVVKRAEALGVGLSALGREEYLALSPHFGDDAKSVLDFERSVREREISGGTGPEAVREEIGKARALLAS